MENFLAIFIAVATFIFTIYQWLIAMNSRRPRLQVIGFRPELISFSHKLQFFRIYMPQKWHIVNFADIPNSVMNMKVSVKVAGKCVLAEFSHGEKFKDMFPVLVNNHTYASFNNEPIYSGKAAYFQINQCPSEKELTRVCVQICLEDQYDVIHSQILSTKDLRQDKFEEFPGLSGLYADNEYSKVLAELPTIDTEKKNNLVYVVYHLKSDRREFPHLCISKYSRDTSAAWLGASLYISREDRSWEPSDSAKIQVDDWREEQSKVYLILENMLPKAVDIVLTSTKGVYTHKIDLPKDLVDSFKS